MRVLCGLIGSGVGVLAIHEIPPPNMKLTSYAKGYDVLTGHPQLAWHGWVIIAVIVVGFLIGGALYRGSTATTTQ